MTSRTCSMWLVSVSLLAALWCSPVLAQTLPPGQCDVTTNSNISPCPSSNPDLAVTTTTPLGSPPKSAQAVRSDMGLAAVPVDVYNLCRYIDNNSTGNGASIFVPFNSPAEWLAFRTAATSGALASYINLTLCSRTWTTSISPSTPPAATNCNNPVPASQPITLPYARYPDPNTGQPPQQTEQVVFQCTDNSGNVWPETATAIYQGLDSDDNSPSWTLTSLTYSTEGEAGACGPANGKSYADATNVNAAGLCSSGTASPASVVDPGPWNWTCTSTGAPANCSASVLISFCALPHEGICYNGQVCYANNLQDYPLCVSGATLSNYTDTRVDDTETMSGTCSENGSGQNCVRIVIHQCVPPNC